MFVVIQYFFECRTLDFYFREIQKNDFNNNCEAELEAESRKTIHGRDGFFFYIKIFVREFISDDIYLFEAINSSILWDKSIELVKCCEIKRI